MADLDEIIFKLSLEGDGYIRGADALTESTKRFTQAQEEANKKLQQSEAALKTQTTIVEKNRITVDEVSKSVNRKFGDDTRAITNLKKSQEEQQRLTDIVNANRKAYDEATKAAQDFADIAARARQLQDQAAGGKIPTTPPVGIQPPIIPEIGNIIDSADLKELPGALVQIKGEFDNIRESIVLAEERMKELNKTDAEFIQIEAFIKKAKEALSAYDEAVKLASESTEQLGERVVAAQDKLAVFGSSNVDELPIVVAESKEQFDQLRLSVQLAEERLKGLDSASDEFKNLVQFITEGKTALTEFDAVSKKIGETTKTFTQEIRAANLELKRLRDAGKEGTKEFTDQEIKVAKLTDAYEKQRERIKVLASDTRALDFGKASIQAAINGFQVYTSLAVLAGGASEDLQKKTLQLFAAMQLLTSLEQLANSVKKGSVLATNLQSASQAIYTAVVNASATALGRFKLALAATGIGAAILAVGFLVNKFKQLSEGSDEAARKARIMNEVVKESASSFTQAYVEVSKLKDQFALANEGIGSQRDALIEYNKTLGSTVGFANSFREAEQLLIKNADSYIRITQLKAEANLLLGKSAEANLKLDQALSFTIPENIPTTLRNALRRSRDELVKEAQQEVKEVTELFKLVTNKVQEETVKATGKTTQQLLADSLPKPGTVAAAKKVIEDQIGDLKASFDKLAATNLEGRKKNLDDQKKLQDQLDALTGKKPKAAVDNTFEQERADLQAKLKELRNKEVVDIQKINDEFAAKLEAERLRIQKEIKDKKIFGDLTKPLEEQPKTQAGILFQIQVQINEEQRKQALDKLAKDTLDAQNKLNDDLKALQNKATADRINLIQDEFERRAALIAFNEQTELDNARENVEDRLAALDLQKLLIGEQSYQDAKNAIITNGEQNALNIIAKFGQERQDLSEDTFQKLLSDLGGSLNERDTQAAEQLATQIQDERDKFDAGLISRKEFEDNVSKITKAAVDYRNFLHKQELQLQLDALNVEIEKTDDPAVLEKLKKQQLDIRNALAEANTGAATTLAPATAAVDKVNEYAQAIGSLVDSIVSFWQKANEAEAAALDRSIALQEKRVDAAQRIAERGNAQYLKAEADRLKELQIARENAARRDLAINAALQASQLLVGITGAITKIATPGVGTADVIAAVAVIFGALASGFALVKSLQGNQPKFKTGTTYVSRGTQPRGEDTIPAWLSEGEAVIPEKKNKSYKKSVEAIYHGKVPADVLNKFVENYVDNRYETVNNMFTTVARPTVPQVNYERIKEAAEIHISHDSKLAGLLSEQTRKIEENTLIQKQVLSAVKKSKIDVHYDAEGLTVRQMEIMDQMKKDKRI